MKKPLQLDEWVLAQTTEQSVQSLIVRCYFTENENKFKSLLSLSGGSCAHKNILSLKCINKKIHPNNEEE